MKLAERIAVTMTCPVDGRPLKGRALFCSGRCRTWVCRLGGPVGAADAKERLAEQAVAWAPFLPTQDLLTAAAECRQQAGVLREYAEHERRRMAVSWPPDRPQERSGRIPAQRARSPQIAPNTEGSEGHERIER